MNKSMIMKMLMAYNLKGLNLAEKLHALDPPNIYYKIEIFEFKGVIARLNGDQQLIKNKPEKALDYYQAPDNKKNLRT